MKSVKEREKDLERQAKLRAKTRRNKKYGQAPSHGMGRIRCEMCGKPLSKHDIIKLCDG
jgi:hypothetical protein